MASPPPRLIATDLDGTFLRTDGTVSMRTARTWVALPDNGIETVLVTARPPRWLHDLSHVVGAHGIAICGNGEEAVDVPQRIFSLLPLLLPLPKVWQDFRFWNSL